MQDLEQELRESIAYFEQILHVLPDDRAALEFLCVACAQLGDQEAFLGHALALADILLRDKSAEGAQELLEKLQGVDDPRAKAAVLKLQVLAAPPPEFAYEKSAPRATCATQEAATQAETALLRRLVDDGVLLENQVKPAFEQLAHPPTAGDNFLISALAILEKENLPGAAEAAAAVADAAHAPPVPLDAFELVPAHVRALPEKLVRVRGAVAFAKLGRDWAVALLNPLDEDLRTEVAETLGARCHFFLAQPSALDKVLDRLYEGEGEKPT